MALLETPRPCTGLVIHVPIKRVHEQKTFRSFESERRNVGYAEDQPREFLLVGETKFARLLQRIGLIAARIGEQYDLCTRRLRLQEERREVVGADWMASGTDDLAAAFGDFVGSLLFEIVAERVIGSDEIECF